MNLYKYQPNNVGVVVNVQFDHVGATYLALSFIVPSKGMLFGKQ